MPLAAANTLSEDRQPSPSQPGACDWHQIRQACTGRPMVNASLALHHIADDEDGADQRDAVLRHLRALNPALLVLAEPDARRPALPVSAAWAAESASC